MKIGVLTSSRADYSIYYPLLRALSAEAEFSVEILAFGTHLSKKHGYTIEQIRNDGFIIATAVSTIVEDDSPAGVSHSMGTTVSAFADIWAESNYDLLFALGDRYEMFAACASTVPFNIPLAHLHGGEETLGAIDDAFRHSITHMAKYHFTAAQPYHARVVELKRSSEGVYNVGSLSIDNLRTLKLLTLEEFKNQFSIDLSVPTILITFHPETVSYEKNEFFIDEVIAALDSIQNYQFVITMPNADTMGNLIREKLKTFASRNDAVIPVESFGTIGYLSCMKHCSFMLGNTSSGFIEASYFPKYVINLGDRQKGRIVTPNIKETKIDRLSILKAVEEFADFSPSQKVDIYGCGQAAETIVGILKNMSI